LDLELLGSVSAGQTQREGDMANRTERRNTIELDKLTRQDAATAFRYLSSPTLNLQVSNNFDDLVISLAGARENRRARQVNEWERIARQTLSRDM
jgi:hypothetical protein